MCAVKVGYFTSCGSLRISINRHEGPLGLVLRYVSSLDNVLNRVYAITTQNCRAYSQYYCPAFYNYALSAQFRTYELDPFSW